jgi:hypothetical protein
MRSIRRIMLEQARASRERAEFYRQLARTMGQGHAVLVFEKSARDLEERAGEMEKYAIWFAGPGENPIPADDTDYDPESEAAESNVVAKLQRAIELALSMPKKPDGC